MKTYMLQMKTYPNCDWHLVPSDANPLKSQSIKYMRGFQDAMHVAAPSIHTRIVEVRGVKLASVRVCANWKPF